MMPQLDPFDAPVPGESLTTSPEQRYPFEKPPEIVDEQEAIEEIFLRITEEDVLDDILDLIRQDLPVEDIAQVILFEGFRTGQYTPDLFLMLIEPTIYILLALAEYAGIEATLYPEGDFDEDPEEGGMRSLTSINQLLERKKMGEGEGTGETPVLGEGDSITVGDRVIERPESITPSMLETIQSKLGGQ